MGKIGSWPPPASQLSLWSPLSLPKYTMVPFCEGSTGNGTLGKVSLGNSEFKFVSFKEGESRGDAAAAKKLRHLEVINDLFVCPRLR